MNPLAFDAGQDWSRSAFIDLTPFFLAGLAVFALTVGVSTWLMWLDVRDRRRRRQADGKLCPACGYDLRASPGRCPECGAAGGGV